MEVVEKEENEDPALLFQELMEMEQRGIITELNNVDASPLQIVRANALREDDVEFMRDYVIDDQGNIEKVCFNGVKRL